MLLAVVLLLWLPGCRDDSSSEDITVFAAASLTESFTEIGEQFEADNPGTTVTFNFGASSALVEQLGSGAPVDVLATAAESNMADAVDAGTVEQPSTFARNRLAIVVAPGNPKGIETVADLDQPDVSFVLCAPEVPCGRFGAAILDRAGISAEPESEEANVKAAVNRVIGREVDASLVYVTDVQAAGDQAEGVDLPEDVNEVATYPIAVAEDAGNKPTAQAFIDYVQSDVGQEILQDAGFDSPG